MNNNSYSNAIYFDKDNYEMDSILGAEKSRWEDWNDRWAIFDEWTGEYIIIEKDTGKIKSFNGFTGLIYDYLSMGYFVVKHA